MRNETKELLKQKYLESPKGWSKWLRASKNLSLLEELNQQYPIPEALSEKMYWLANDLTDYPKCPVCGKQVKNYINQSLGYYKFCSCSCAQLSPETQEKLKQTNLLKYGCENPMQAKVVQDKVRETCLERYGVENSYQAEVFKEKIKQTNLRRYGVENPQQNTEIKNKTKQTMIDEYGVACGFLTASPYKISRGEQEVAEYVKSIYTGNILTSDRTAIWPYELDMYLPELKLGIEYDGDYWHSLPNMVKRDVSKNEKCKKKGITLFRIRESVWQSNPAAVKEELRGLLYNPSEDL